MSLVTVNLHLGVHTVRLSVPAELESVYREAGHQLNEQYEFYRQRQPKASAEQVWMYVALAFAVNLNHDSRDKAMEPVVEKIKEINQLIQSNL